MKTNSRKFVLLSAKFYGPLPSVDTIPVRKLHEVGVKCKLSHTTVSVKTQKTLKLLTSIPLSMNTVQPSCIKVQSECVEGCKFMS